MSGIINWLSGKKTYLTGIAAILTAIAAKAAGEIDWSQFFMAVGAALQTIWIRAGIAKS